MHAVVAKKTRWPMRLCTNLAVRHTTRLRLQKTRCLLLLFSFGQVSPIALFRLLYCGPSNARAWSQSLVHSARTPFVSGSK